MARTPPLVRLILWWVDRSLRLRGLCLRFRHRLSKAMVRTMHQPCGFGAALRTSSGFKDDRPLHLLAFVDWQALHRIPEVETPFVCFIAADAREVPPDVIGAAMRELLKRGCIYIVCWGPDCERVHDIFDEEFVVLYLDDPAGEPDTDSTWHSKESLEHALWFALTIALKGEPDRRCLLALCEDREH